MKYAVVGSRGYRHEERVRMFVRNLKKGDSIVTGGCRGVDQIAEEVARHIGVPVTIHLPQYDRYPKNPRFARTPSPAGIPPELRAAGVGLPAL